MFCMEKYRANGTRCTPLRVQQNTDDQLFSIQDLYKRDQEILRFFLSKKNWVIIWKNNLILPNILYKNKSQKGQRNKCKQ